MCCFGFGVIRIGLGLTSGCSSQSRLLYNSLFFFFFFFWGTHENIAFCGLVISQNPFTQERGIQRHNKKRRARKIPICRFFSTIIWPYARSRRRRTTIPSLRTPREQEDQHRSAWPLRWVTRAWEERKKQQIWGEETDMRREAVIPPVWQILNSFESKNSTGGVSLSISGGDAKHKQWLSSFGVERERERERVDGHGGARGWCVQLC